MRSKKSTDYIRNLGIGLSPVITGEGVHHAFKGLVAAAASQVREIESVKGETFEEASVIVPGRSVDNIALQSKRNGAAIVLGDGDNGETGFVQIVHNSGTIIQIDDAGTVLISSRGNTSTSTDGASLERVAGDKNMTVGRNWNVKVSGADGNIEVQGDLNIECENFNVTARGKASINAAEGMEMKGSRMSMESGVDNLDIIAKNVKIGAVESLSILSGKTTYIGAEGQLNLFAKRETFLSSELDLHIASNGTIFATASTDAKISAGTVYIDDIVRMAEGGATGSGNIAKPASPGIKPVTNAQKEPPQRRPKIPQDMNRDDGDDVAIDTEYESLFGGGPIGREEEGENDG